VREADLAIDLNACAIAITSAAACFQFLSAEHTTTVVVEDDVGLERKLRDKTVGKAVVVVIPKNSAHAGKHFAVVGKVRAGIQKSTRRPLPQNPGLARGGLRVRSTVRSDAYAAACQLCYKHTSFTIKL